MKMRINTFLMTLSVLGVIATPTFADDQQDNATPNPPLQFPQHPKRTHTKLGHQHRGDTALAPVKKDHIDTSSGPDSVATVPQNPETFLQSFPIDIDVPGQSFVSSGPYIGVPLVYSGGNLIINTPNINADVTLLNMRKAINQRMHELNRMESEDHAHLLLSGMVEAQVGYRDPGRGPTSSDIDLTGSELDGYILAPSHWTSALFSFTYDNDRGTDEGSLSNYSRTSNSRLFVNKAFVVIGDFEHSNFYGSFGQMYVPFGTYSSNMISSPLTKRIGQTKARAILIGYQQQSLNAFYTAGYVFRGDTHVGSTARVSNGGINLGYRFSSGGISGDVGVGAIANIADSINMQNNGVGLPYFSGYGAGNGGGTEQITHRVPAVDFHALLSIGKKIDLLAEYVGAIHAFNRQDLTMNTHGAKPQGLNVEAVYTFTAFEKPSSVAIGYGRSRDGLALGLAAQRYSVVFNTSWWKDTLQSLEFRHDINYAAGNYATGPGANVTSPLHGSGRPDNMVTAQFDLYF